MLHFPFRCTNFTALQNTRGDEERDRESGRERERGRDRETDIYI